MTGERPRLDELLVERRIARSRSHAKALILAGNVELPDGGVVKPGTRVQPDVELRVTDPPRYVGRGGKKLEAALESSGVDPSGRVTLDIGASTGGFTDCLLQHGARAVIAVDVGYGQLDWALRQDSRVWVLERTNARYLESSDLPDDAPEPIELMVMDVSFIGIGKVLPAVTRLCTVPGEALVLVKPQFECGPDAVASGGVVPDARSRRRAVADVAEAAQAEGWVPVQPIASPIRGASGNWECFLHLRRDGSTRGADRWSRALDDLEIPDDRGTANGRQGDQRRGRP